MNRSMEQNRKFVSGLTLIEIVGFDGSALEKGHLLQSIAGAEWPRTSQRNPSDASARVSTVRAALVIDR